MDKRIYSINRLLTSYSQGRFNMRLKLDDTNDDLNACMWSFNILGEELEAIAITRDYFNAIFNTIEEMVMVVTRQGLLEDLNSAVCDQLGYTKDDLVGQPVDLIAGERGFAFFKATRRQVSNKGFAQIKNHSFVTVDGSEFPVDLTLKFIGKEPRQLSRGILITAKNATDRINSETAILRAVIGALEQERLRLARDLHDSLGQQLAGTKFLLSTVLKTCRDETQAQQLQAVDVMISTILSETRNMCFNILPLSIKDGGLVKAVRELSQQVELSGSIRLAVRCLQDIPPLSEDLAIDLYRVVQEFVSNTVKHAEATEVRISFIPKESMLGMQLVDNGKGFNREGVIGKGMGLRNIQSRIESRNGTFKLKSFPGRGTRADISIPYK